MKITKIGFEECNTLIKLYPHFESLCKKLDEVIYKIGVSFSNNVDYSMEIYDEIIDLMFKKQRIINIKVALDSCVEKLKDKEKILFRLCIEYHSLSNCELAEMFNVSVRTLYRQKERLNESLSIVLNKSENKDLFINFLNEKRWIDSKEYK